MSAVMAELDHLIAAASIPEFFRAISLEGKYQASGTTLSRREWYTGALFGRRLPPCRFCGNIRVMGRAHVCLEAFMLAEQERV